MKNILDTVHGHILLKEEYLKLIIDTPEFQRLRRIEQSPIRSVYPSARHDRFIHSLGVFHVGQMMVKQLNAEKHEWEIDVDFDAIGKSFLLACLLHDIGHAPFSHTLEPFYGARQALSEVLANAINSKSFSSDLTGKESEAKWHEYVSAWVSIKRFQSEIEMIGGDPEFVARMIIGLFYSDKGDHQIENCMISLLHGDVIDADRLDYTCRDVWASGYHTSSYDLKRIIAALHIRKISEDYVVCFESNVVNEIDNVMNVKDFQMKYVFNHHTVVYDQYLLTSAICYVAKTFFGDDVRKNGIFKDTDSDDFQTACANKLCDINTLITPIKIGAFKLVYPSDGDFITLMKQGVENRYFEEWYSRRYSKFALWKTPDEFAGFFQIKRNQSIESPCFSEKVIATLEEYGLQKEDILIRRVVYKPKILLKSLYLLVHNDVKRFTDIYPEEDSKIDVVFYYVYVTKPESDMKIEHMRQELITRLVPVMKRLYPELYANIQD